MVNRPGNISDYGGNAHYRRGARTTRMSREKLRSFRCSDCNKIRFLTRLELTRAAVQHCLECGGSLEETKASRKRRIQQTDAQKLAIAGAYDFDTDENVSATQYCICCESGWTDKNALFLHVVTKSECLEEYMATRELVNVKGQLFLKQTLHCFDLDKEERIVMGITAAGTLEKIQTFKRKKDALVFLEDHGVFE